MPDSLDAYLDPPAAPRSPRDRVHSIASQAGIAPEIADDYLKLARVESGHNVNVRDSAKGAQGFGQVMPDAKGGTTRTVGGRKFNLRDPDQNIEAGLRYFSEGGSDPVARRLHYFGGPRARQTYERTGRIPNISDGNMTAAQYVRATGAQRQKPTSDLDAYLDPQPSPQATPPRPTNAATAKLKRQDGRKTRQQPEQPQGMSMGDFRRMENAESMQRNATREQVKQERAGRRGPYGSPSVRGLLHLAASPAQSFSELLTPEDENVERETQERLNAADRARSPEVTSIRQEYGAMPAAERSVVAPLARGGASMLKLAGGITSLAGLTPNQFSDWANKRAQVVSEASSLPPLSRQQTLNSLVTGETELKEVKRGTAEKIATGIADLGIGLGEIVLLKKATRLPFNQLLALESAVKSSDKPLKERAASAAEAYALGTVLDQHLSRAASAAVFAAPTAAQSGEAVMEGRLSPVDAAIQTGIQAGAGAVLGGKGERPVRVGEMAGIKKGVGPSYSVLDLTDTHARLQTPEGPQLYHLSHLEGRGRGTQTEVQPPVEAQREAVESAVPPPTSDVVRLFRADAPDAPAASGQNWANSVHYVSQKYGAGQMGGQESVWYIDIPKSRLDEAFGDWRAVSGTTASVLKANGIEIEPKLFRRITESPTATPVRFYHRDYGEVVESPNQRRVGKNRVRVVAEDGSEHVIKRSAMSGAGNQRAVPIREPAPELSIEQYLEPQGQPVAPPDLSATESQLSPRQKGEPGEPANKVAATEVIKPTSSQAPGQETVPDKVPESTTSARKEMVRGDRAELDLPELPTAERKSWRESLDKAKPEQANTLADEVLNRPRPLTDEETASLVVRAQEIKNRHSQVMKEVGETQDAEVIAQKRAESDALEREFDKLTEATKKSGTEKGRALAAQKLTINQDFDLVSMKNRLKTAKGENLTSQETAKVEELHARLSKAESELAEANEKLAHRDLQRQIDRASRQRKRTETKQSLDDEFVALQSQFVKAKAEVKNIHASGLAGIDPEGKLTALVAKMARNRVKAGITDAAQLVDDIHAAIKDSVEGITKRDIRDAISGYGLEPKGDKRSEDAKQLADIRTELRNLSKSEDVAGGRRLSAKDSARRTHLEKQEADLTRRMQVKDFEFPERNKPQYTRETYEKEKRVKELKAEFEKMRYRATRSVTGKIADTAVGVGNVPKTLLSMADLSALLRQGGVGFVQHPALSTRAAGDMLRSFTEHGFANVESAIKSSPEFENAKRSGVEFTGIDREDPRLSKREEGYLGGGVIDTLAKGRFNVPGKALKGVKDFSERTFVSFLDSQRMRIFEQQSQALRDMKLIGKELDAALKSQAKYINIITGRGSLGAEGNKLAPALNLAMFSPRLVASRFQLLNKMLNPVAWARMPKGARKLQMIDNAKFVVGTAGVLGLAKAAGAGVNTDPDDADFLKIKVGNTRYDTLAGLQQPMRFMLRMAKAIKGGETYSGADKGDIFADFARSKASPEIGLAADWLAGSNRLSGKKFEPVKDTARTLIPLPAQDFYEAIREDGKLRGTIETLPSLLGVGVQTYKGSAEKATTEAEKLARRFIQRKMPDEARDQEQIDLDTKKSELRARSRKGDDVSSEVKALGARLTERQAKGILDARNKTRLQEDLNRLGIKDALLVYSVASPAERTQMVAILERKQRLIEMLPDSEREAVRKRWNDLGLGASRTRFGRPDRPSRPQRAARQ